MTSVYSKRFDSQCLIADISPMILLAVMAQDRRI